MSLDRHMQEIDANVLNIASQRTLYVQIRNEEKKTRQLQVTYSSFSVRCIQKRKEELGGEDITREEFVFFVDEEREYQNISRKITTKKKTKQEDGITTNSNPKTRERKKERREAENIYMYICMYIYKYRHYN